MVKNRTIPGVPVDLSMMDKVGDSENGDGLPSIGWRGAVWIGCAVCRFSVLAALLLSVCWLCAEPVDADELTQGFSANAGVQYNSNPLLSPEYAQSVWLTTLTPDYSLSDTSGLNQWTIDAGLNLQRSSNPNVMLNREDPTVTLSWTRMLESGKFDLKANYSQVSTLIAPGQQDVTGVLGQDGTQYSKLVAADWQYDLADTWSVSNEVKLSEVSFSYAPLMNYQSRQYSSTLTKVNSDTLSTFARLMYVQILPESYGSPETQGSAVVGFQWDLSGKLQLAANVGYNEVSGSGVGYPAGTAFQSVYAIPVSGASSSGSGVIGDAKMTYQNSQSKSLLDVSRTNMPSGFGGFLEADTVLASWEYDLTGRKSLGVDYSLTKNLDLYVMQIEQYDAWVSYQLTNNLSLKLLTQYRTMSSSGLAGSDDIIGLMLQYKYPDF